MRYALATPPGMSDRIVEIPKDRYDATVRARSGLLECLFIEEKFDLVIQDYLDWERALLEGGLGYLAAPVLNGQHAAADRAIFNRRLMNLLSSAKTYTEQVPGRHVPEVLPETDASAVKASFSKQYDDRLGYRAMEALRNHAQHYDAPVREVSYPSRRVERQADVVLAFNVDPRLQPEALRRNPKFKVSVLKELEALGEFVPIKPFVRQYIEGLWVVHAQIRSLVAPLIGEWEAILGLAKSSFLAGGNDERSAFLLSAVVLGDNDTYEDMVSLNPQFNEYRRFLENKNRHLDNLALRYVTNETADTADQSGR